MADKKPLVTVVFLNDEAEVARKHRQEEADAQIVDGIIKVAGYPALSYEGYLKPLLAIDPIINPFYDNSRRDAFKKRGTTLRYVK